MADGTPADATPADADRWGWAPPRSAWPAWLCAAALLLYAVEKAYYATQGKLGLPFGTQVPASVYQELHHVALRQWTLSTVGLTAGLLAFASVSPLGRYLPRWLMLVLLWGALIPMAAGLPYVLRDVLTKDSSALGPTFGVVRPVAQLALWAAMAWSYQRRSRVLRRRADR